MWYMMRYDCKTHVMIQCHAQPDPTETAAITARLLAGESVAAVARSMGRSRQALSRIKGSLDRKEVRRLSW